LPISIVPDRARVIVVPAGEVDIACADDLDREVRELRRSGFDRIAIDLRELELLTSAGLRVLLSLRNDAKRDGHELTLIPGARAVQRVFDITATRTLFDWERP
jgi:anti-anti-sigma factor